MIQTNLFSNVIAFLFSIFCVSCFGQMICGTHKSLFARELEDSLNVECMLADIKQLKDELISSHPKMDYYCTKEDIDSAFNMAEIQCATKKTTKEFIEILSSMLHTMKDSHTNLSPLVLTQFKNINRVFPFYLEQIEGKYYMKKCYNEIIPPGVECLEIDDVEFHQIHKKAKIFAFQEGESKAANEQMALKLIARIFSVYYLKNKEFITFKIVDYRGDTLLKKIQSVTLRSVIFNKDWNRTETNSFWFDSSGTACMNLGSFSARRNKGMKKFIDDFFKEVELNKSNHIVIDLRDDSGGYVSIKNYLINYLDISKTDKRERYDFIRSDRDRFSSLGWWIKYRYRSYLKKYPNDTLVAKEWKYIQSKNGTHCSLFYPNEMKLGGQVYKGRVSVAMNGLSMSASVMFCSWIKSSGRGELYGDMCMGGSNGTFGDAVQFKLKHSKIPINMSTVKITPLSNIDFSYAGLSPDIYARPTIFQLKNGIDPIKELLGFTKKTVLK